MQRRLSSVECRTQFSPSPSSCHFLLENHVTIKQVDFFITLSIKKVRVQHMFHCGGVAKVLPRLPAVFRIRIRIPRIHMFLGLPDPDPDPLVRCMDPDPSVINTKVRKILIPTV